MRLGCGRPRCRCGRFVERAGPARTTQATPVRFAGRPQALACTPGRVGGLRTLAFFGSFFKCCGRSSSWGWARRRGRHAGWCERWNPSRGYRAGCRGGRRGSFRGRVSRAAGWGDKNSPAFGTLNDYHLFRIHTRTKAERMGKWGECPTCLQDVYDTFTAYVRGDIDFLPWSPRSSRQPGLSRWRSKLCCMTLRLQL